MNTICTHSQWIRTLHLFPFLVILCYCIICIWDDNSNPYLNQSFSPFFLFLNSSWLWVRSFAQIAYDNMSASSLLCPIVNSSSRYIIGIRVTFLYDESTLPLRLYLLRSLEILLWWGKMIPAVLKVKTMDSICFLWQSQLSCACRFLCDSFEIYFLDKITFIFVVLIEIAKLSLTVRWHGYYIFLVQKNSFLLNCKVR